MPASLRTSLQRSTRDSFDDQNEPPRVIVGTRNKNKHCKYCEKTFRKTEHLLRHERSHTKEKPFHCDMCSKAYTRHDTLLRHSKTHDIDQSHLEAGITLSQMNHDDHIALEDISHGVEQNAIERHETNFDPDLENTQGWRRGVLEQINNNTTQNGYESQASSFPSVYPTVSLDENPPDLSSVTSIQTDRQVHPMADPFPVPMGNSTGVSPLSANNLWGASLMSPGPSWLIGYDFDLEALNTSVSATIGGITEPLFQPQIYRTAVPHMPQLEVVPEAEVHKEQYSANESVQRGWFSHIDPLNEDDRGGLTTGEMTPVTSRDQYDVGDSFRQRITQRLRARTNDEPLPSTKFLNLSVQIYFTKFNPIFPVIHSQTFRPTPKNSLLLLSITSIGSLLLGSKGAAGQGIRIFERLNKAVLASWENAVLSDPTEAASMIQAALIGQTFGLLSGVPMHLATVEAFHGSIIAWARRCGMFNYIPPHPQVEHLSGASLHEAWKAWARSESIVRTVLGLYIHDAKLACMFHHEPLLRHDSILMSVAADDDLFNAPSAIIWREKMLRKSAPRVPIHECLHVNLNHDHGLQPLSQELCWKSSSFTAYVVLHGISASIIEKQQMSQIRPASANFNKHFDALICWYLTFQSDSEPQNPPRPDTLCLLVLWHTVFMSLVTNFNILERAIGRNGAESSTLDADIAYTTSWATSREAQRCILHAHALIYSLGALRLDAEAAIHIPHCLFLAGIASYCYTRFRRPNPGFEAHGHNQTTRLPTPGQQPIIEFPEFTIRGAPIPQHLFGSPTASSSVTGRSPATNASNAFSTQEDHTTRFRPTSDVSAAMMCTLIDMLQRIGHWGIARKYAATLSTLVYADSDEDWKFIMGDC